jgi:predicted metal-binding membrane protein
VTTTPAARDRRRIRVPLFVAAACAWVVLAVGPMPMAMAMPADGHPGVAPADHMPGMSSGPEPGGLAVLVPGVALMVVAMMWPLLGPAIGHVRARSLARRRGRAVASFLATYTLVWVAAGTLLAGLAAAAAASGLGAGPVLVAVLVVALVWQVSPVRQRCLNRSHRHPELAAFGPAAVTDVVRFGTVHGSWCVGSCWALMLVPFVVPVWHLPVMALITLRLAYDRFAAPTEPRWFTPRRRTVPARLRMRLPIRRRGVPGTGSGATYSGPTLSW